MRFLRDAVLTIVLLVVIAAIAAFVVARRGGLAANKEPGRLEHSIADQLVRLSIPSDADRQRNPFEADADVWRDAQRHYEDHCAVCHGRDGRGSEIGANMYPRVPDLTHSEVQERSDGALFHIIQNGIRWTGMPAWQEEHSAEDTWKLVAFIRKTPTLTEADLPRDVPAATTGEQSPEKHADHPNAGQ
jgi:mono/diheme cytochrome c family protein